MSVESKNGKFVSTSYYQHRDISPVPEKSSGFIWNCAHIFLFLAQRAKKVVTDSPGLMDFAIGLVNSVFNLPDGQVMFFEEFK